MAIFLATRKPKIKNKYNNNNNKLKNSWVWGKKRAKKKPIDENSPLKKIMILGLYDNWLHFGNPKTLNPTIHVHHKDRTSILVSPFLFFNSFVGLAYQDKDIVFRFIIEYSSQIGPLHNNNRSIFIIWGCLKGDILAKLCWNLISELEL